MMCNLDKKDLAVVESALIFTKSALLRGQLDELQTECERVLVKVRAEISD